MAARAWVPRTGGHGVPPLQLFPGKLLDGDRHGVGSTMFICIDDDGVVAVLEQRAGPASRVVGNEAARGRTHQGKPHCLAWRGESNGHYLTRTRTNEIRVRQLD